MRDLSTARSRAWSRPAWKADPTCRLHVAQAGPKAALVPGVCTRTEGVAEQREEVGLKSGWTRGYK